MVCRDCPPGTVRASPHPGPRCATHHRAVNKARSARAHEQMAARRYGLGPGDYDRIYAAQGGHCALCLRATGKGRRRLSIDHDHKTSEVRGLLCSICNKILGHSRDEPEYGERLAAYLRNPPARTVLKGQST